MSLAIAVQMDPVESINIETDSTFVTALEAQWRGHRLFYYQPRHLSLREGRLFARGHDLSLRRERGNHYVLGPRRVVDLGEMDVVLLRQDPPFDMAYITNTHLLEHLPARVLVVNEPREVRNAPEKLLVTHFRGLMPPTLISNDLDEVRAFRAKHRDIIIKPLFGAGGIGVFHLRSDDENLTALMELFGNHHREPLMIQQYLPAIREGDKRIILIEGEPVGAVSRMPLEGEARANFHSGGRAKKAVLSPRDSEICATIGPLLRERGLIFAGIDVIGPYLTEINVTSPTGIQEINRLDSTRLEAKLVDAIETRAVAKMVASR